MTRSGGSSRASTTATFRTGARGRSRRTFLCGSKCGWNARRARCWSSWSLSVDSCNQAKVLYNGLTANDRDEDNVPIPTDRCPAVDGNGFANGCPLYDRALTIAYKKRAGRFVGRLGATDPGHRLRRGMPVTVWRVQARTRPTDRQGSHQRVRQVRGHEAREARSLLRDGARDPDPQRGGGPQRDLPEGARAPPLASRFARGRSQRVTGRAAPRGGHSSAALISCATARLTIDFCRTSMEEAPWEI